MKIKNIYLAAVAFIMLLSACKTEDEMLIKPIKAFKPYSIQGFAIAPLEQYFDGVKVREIHGPAALNVEMAFATENVVMEFKAKGSNQSLYTQTFNINDKDNIVPKFYFDGVQIHSTYNYPDPEGAEYKANFYFDFPKEAGLADVYIEFVEYYMDDAAPDGVGIAKVTSFPIARNIETGKWSSYFTLGPSPDFPEKTRADSDFMTFVTVRKAGSDHYFVKDEEPQPYNKFDYNGIPLELPQPDNTAGKTQSIYIGMGKIDDIMYLRPKQDLVQLFPH